MERKIMIREIENRRSIRKYKQDKIDRNCCGWLADEAPAKRPRKPLEEIVEYR